MNNEHLRLNNFKTDESVIATQRTFCAHFIFSWIDAVPDRKLILLWVENFKTIGSLIKMKATWMKLFFIFLKLFLGFIDEYFCRSCRNNLLIDLWWYFFICFLIHNKYSAYCLEQILKATPHKKQLYIWRRIQPLAVMSRLVRQFSAKSNHTAPLNWRNHHYSPHYEFFFIQTAVFYSLRSVQLWELIWLGSMPKGNRCLWRK